MVGKLIKKDIKDSSKAHLPVFGMIIVGTFLAIFGLSFASSNSQLAVFITSITGFVVFGLVIAIMVMSIRATIYVLYSSIYTKNAYRLFTLPVKPWQILVSKIVTVSIWSVLISIVTLLSTGAIVGYVAEDIFIIFRELGEVITQLRALLTPSIIAAFLINTTLGTIFGYMVLIFAGSVANSSLIRRSRGIFTFLISLITLSFYSWLSNTFGANLQSVMNRFDFNSFLMGTMEINFSEFLWVFAFIGLVISFLILATLWFWENKLEITN